MNFAIDSRLALSTPSLPDQTTAAERKSHDLVKLRDSARDFESIFIDEMFKAMRKTVMDDDDNSLIKKDNATKMFEEMRDMEIAKVAAQGDGIGIGEEIYNQMAPLIMKKVY